ncbi:unnamed protein product (macronuclear) [Paramecium tetraurelia]|uniref:Serine/threonine-protein phosphatase 4 regulatory subunit 3-like central domain-containing protein n=1 Tax=Paramecium tetraurelia TaxID=5888 RepID=A0D074_PARTE|nr:uncharacterized protein GSPATT00011993001 [Paramecium tetraurelia]CAK76441.1 unnamed protein product [Paramecium tetraurelia]|eukprot:XP_001443838.1 hypothetical protein (macronuclear) [Paramecium tetraurelia strain d4-2]
MKQNSEIHLCKLHQFVQDKWNWVNTGYIHFNSKNEMLLLEKDTSMEVFAVSVKQEYDFFFDGEEGIQFQFNEYYGLSFQSKEGAQVVWSKIQNILNEEDDDESIVLTPVNESTLPLILETMSKLIQGGTQTKQMLSSYLLNKKDYFEMLNNLFNQLEKDHNQELLEIMCSIVKNIVTVSEHELFQTILSDQIYMFIFGALEYDKEMAKSQFVPHRQFLEKNVQFLQVVQIKSKERLKTIHFIYRLQYLRDCGLAYYIDEYQQMFIKIVLTCYVDLLKYIENSKEFLVDLIDQLRNFNFLALRFLNEICSVFKEYQDLNKAFIYQRLSEHGLYEIIEDYIVDSLQSFQKQKAKFKKLKIKIQDDIFEKTSTLILELVISCLQHYPYNFRQYIVSEHQQVLKYPLFNVIVDHAFDNDSYLEILKLLIDNTQDEQNEILDCFLSLFYPKISQSISHQSRIEQKTLFVELSLGLSRNLKASVKDVLIQNQIALKMGFILQEKNKILQMKCLQFFKILILQRDEEINKEVIMAFPNLISPLLLYKGLRENLIFSQFLEIVKIIYEGGNQNIIKSLEQELKFWEQHSNYLKIHDIFKSIKSNCMKQQFSTLSVDSKPQQQQANYNVIDDEIDLFKSVQGHSTPLHKQTSKKLVEYDDDVEVISKKTKLD